MGAAARAHAEEVEKAKEQHRNEVAELSSEHIAAIEAARGEHEAAMGMLKAEHEEAVAAAGEELERTKAEHGAALADREEKMGAAARAHAEEVEKAHVPRRMATFEIGLHALENETWKRTGRERDVVGDVFDRGKDLVDALEDQPNPANSFFRSCDGTESTRAPILRR